MLALALVTHVAHFARVARADLIVDTDQPASPARRATPAQNPRTTCDTVTINITGARSDKGVAAAAIWNTREGFPRDSTRALDRKIAPLHNGSATVTFTGLACGRYAVTILHDEDGDRELDTGWFGIPKEGIGSSNNLKPKFGPPAFDESAFTVDSNNAIISVEFYYF